MRRLFIVIFILATCTPYAQMTRMQRASTGALKILPIDEKTYSKLLAQTKGKVKLVNFWATWCQPCVTEFPGILKLREKYQARGLEVIFVSADLVDDKNGPVTEFLRKHNVDFITYILDAKDTDGFINAVSDKWSGALPATFIYDQKGHLVSSLFGKKDFQEFEKMILPLIQ